MQGRYKLIQEALEVGLGVIHVIFIGRASVNMNVGHNVLAKGNDSISWFPLPAQIKVPSKGSILKVAVV